ncbi:MAG: glycosyl transferase 4, partial [Lachnospiraceae bacterium]|nr:glycosyl transferase 4 [Lachnospiraceae bacterium]
MRVLWLCNIMLPAIAEELGVASSNKEGWLTGLAEQLIRHREENGIALGVCFPVGKGEAPLQGTAGGLRYFGFIENTSRPECYDKSLEVQFAAVLKAYRPDVVHIFGTEFPHTLAMARSVQDKKRVLIGIQGICSKIADFYTADLPKSIVNRFLIRDILRWDNIALQQKKFVQRGRMETEALRSVGHITGRTAWARQALAELAPAAEYHYKNETLGP